ncbi:MAG: hypothetical protein M3R17_17910 [Bacteroidota bacterium]|nr:hypothetical protein [Bacteroidota bacterium]
MFDSLILIYKADLKNGENSCSIRIEEYWADLKNKSSWFKSENSNFPKHDGRPEDFKTKMRLDNDCQRHIPKERRGDLLNWIEERIQEAFGPNCEIEITYKRPNHFK